MTSKPPIIDTVEIESTAVATAGIRRAILSKLKEFDYSEDDVFAIHLALEEALANALKHGNGNDPSKKVRVELFIDNKKVEIFITDQGRGFVPEKVPDPRCDSNLYKTEGRGLLLIKSYMDEVEYNDSGNQVHMVKYR